MHTLSPREYYRYSLMSYKSETSHALQSFNDIHYCECVNIKFVQSTFKIHIRSAKTHNSIHYNFGQKQLTPSRSYKISKRRHNNTGTRIIRQTRLDWLCTKASGSFFELFRGRRGRRASVFSGWEGGSIISVYVKWSNKS